MPGRLDGFVVGWFYGSLVSLFHVFLVGIENPILNSVDVFRSVWVKGKFLFRFDIRDTPFVS